ncbi:bifunctional nitrate reductase/sulfite reductase flavoprotein subunit alpha [Cellulomonas wangsupingiae]|uniref:Bifunctional nitrate reductase/sulfite reductase flavoprotein subunit alpha n=1 Tax=Cellulomonas wangsupingiae TaxID=2968085 RepID=A0ABY5KCW8_9CELL|nr:bifunctional nitrate reductase/sulfite reductase flavoprotein subunit alpha [Cellulomonas wangsupingiae]MCC2333130.1 bifunctional nitrate reductase/sulfite reductase flavoprotein subunit alpha [Cellulomonas wangsupingiae]UUI66846.1 bifunctional nitrate reductase/sulfite reductase flavoprotein subunit alpha [Cellulomonas wangsupingiae]
MTSTTTAQDERTATTQVATVCSYCGVGCGIVLDVGPDGAVRRASGDRSHPSNAGRLCTKGATSATMLAAGGRLTRALVRPERGAEPVPADVDAAIDTVAHRLREILDRDGPDAIALYVSGQMSIEAQYLANKLAKGFLRTNQIESNSRLCMASAGTGYKLSLGSDGPPGSYDDLDHADVFLVIGANMADCHPVLFLRLLDRVKAGARLVVVDPRRTATADKADLFLQVRPGTDIALLNGLLHLLVEADAVDEEFVATHTQGWEAMPELLADYPPEVVESITGVPQADLRAAAAMIAGARDWVSCWTMGLNQSTHGTWNTNALVNLHLATGAIGRRGSGPFSLTGQPNAMGGREMGYMGPGLPGQRSVLDPDDRAFCEDLWQVPRGTIRADGVGAGTVDMFRRMADGEIRACWVICTNPVASVGNRRTVIEGLERAELVVAQDVFVDTETNAYADVVLPAAMWSEADGVMVSSERTMTLARRALAAPGQALPDWQLVARVATAMGFEGFAHTSSQEVFDELRRASNPRTGYDLRGISYDRLRREPVQWPCASPDAPARNPVRYLNDGEHRPVLTYPDGTRPRLAFATPSGRAVFHARPHADPAELPDDDHPFWFTTGRVQHQWHTMTKTGKVPALNKLEPGPFVEVNPVDAARLGLVGGATVEVASRRGRAVLPVDVTDRVPPGTCFAPFHWNDVFGEYLAVNAVTNDAVDPLSFQPELKACAVALTPVTVVEPATAAPASGATPSTPPPDAPAPPRGPGIDGPVTMQALAAALGVDDVATPVLGDDERRYLSGFLAGLGRGAAGTPVLPPSAPLSGDHALWVDGVLAGMFSRAPVPAGPAAATRTVTVLWASQTGTAEEVAGLVARRLAGAGRTPRVVAMDDALDDLPRSGDLVLVTSTFGDGDAPDNGAALWELLADPEAPSFEGARFAVLALGDPSYDRFCGHGRRLDGRLAELGGQRLLPRLDRAPGDDEAVGAWLDVLVVALTPDAAGPATASAVATDRAPVRTSPVLPPQPAAAGAAADAGPPRATRARPGAARIVVNRRLGAPGSGKEVRQVVLDTTGSPLPLTYRAGDAVAVHPVNTGPLVELWLARTGLSGDEAVTLDGARRPLADALRTDLDLTRPATPLLRFVADRSADPDLRRLLGPGHRDTLRTWLWGRQVVDVVAGVRADAQAWVDVLPRLQPRQYSISSSPHADPDRIAMTVGVVRYSGPAGDPRAGVCSAYLADAADGAQLAVHVQPSAHFHLPEDGSVPVVMVGPGTGVAPFLGFLAERRARAATGPGWLFFGERHAATDFWYREELAELQAQGVLTRLDTAFSRDQRTTVYVQDRMREQGARLWSWLEQGAHVYVCGDAARMAADVDRALRDVVASHGATTPQDAAAYVSRMAKERRYVRDVY